MDRGQKGTTLSQVPDRSPSPMQAAPSIPGTSDVNADGNSRCVFLSVASELIVAGPMQRYQLRHLLLQLMGGQLSKVELHEIVAYLRLDYFCIISLAPASGRDLAIKQTISPVQGVVYIEDEGTFRGRATATFKATHVRQTALSLTWTRQKLAQVPPRLHLALTFASSRQHQPLQRLVISWTIPSATYISLADRWSPRDLQSRARRRRPFQEPVDPLYLQAVAMQSAE